MQECEFIKQIDDTFLSTTPTKKTIKFETGYLKLFPGSRSAYNSAEFEIKLREKVDIRLDYYVDKVFNGGSSSTSISVINNMFNTAHHDWLLNRHWCDKLKEGHISKYYQNKTFCLDTNMRVTMVAVTSVSNDDSKSLLFNIDFLCIVSFLHSVHDSFD